MTELMPSDLDLIRRSMPLIDAAPEKFAKRFYSRLFRLAPETRSMFPDDLTELRTKLVDELVFLSNAADDLDTFVERSRALGERHATYGVQAPHFDLLETALVGSLAEAAGVAWTEDLQTAWQALYRHIAAEMQAAASQNAT